MEHGVPKWHAEEGAHDMHVHAHSCVCVCSLYASLRAYVNMDLSTNQLLTSIIMSS